MGCNVLELVLLGLSRSLGTRSWINRLALSALLEIIVAILSAVDVRLGYVRKRLMP